MARTVTVAQMLSDLEERCDIQNDLQFTQAEKIRLLSQAHTSLWDRLVTASPPDYFLNDTTFATTAGTVAYALPADFYKLRRVQVTESAGRRRSLIPMQPDDRVMLLPPEAGTSVVLEYIPTAPVLASTSDSIDGINGWEEMVVLTAAIKVFRKKGLDVSPLAAELQDARQRVDEMAYRDEGAPPRILRTGSRELGWPFATSTLTHYRLRGASLELYRITPTVPFP
jgi:hypothetical protein